MTNKKSLVGSVFICMMLLLPLQSQARGSVGAYIGFGFGHGVRDEISPTTDEAGLANKLYLGFRIMGPIGVEFGFHDLGTYNDGDDDYSASSYAAVYTVTTKSATLFVKAGMADWTFKDVPNNTEISEVDLMYGFGINLPISPRLFFRTEWETFMDVGEDPAGPTPGRDVNHINFGVNYMF